MIDKLVNMMLYLTFHNHKPGTSFCTGFVHSGLCSDLKLCILYTIHSMLLNPCKNIFPNIRHWVEWRNVSF